MNAVKLVPVMVVEEIARGVFQEPLLPALRPS